MLEFRSLNFFHDFAGETLQGLWRTLVPKQAVVALRPIVRSLAHFAWFDARYMYRMARFQKEDTPFIRID